MATSMVKGNPVKLMLSFAFPLLIGNLLQQTYNIIDAAIVGQALGPEALTQVPWRLSGLTRDEAAASPAIRQGDRLIAAPKLYATLLLLTALRDRARL